LQLANSRVSSSRIAPHFFVIGFPKNYRVLSVSFADDYAPSGSGGHP
jgi:hypothetical protein